MSDTPTLPTGGGAGLTAPLATGGTGSTGSTSGVPSSDVRSATNKSVRLMLDLFYGRNDGPNLPSFRPVIIESQRQAFADQMRNISTEQQFLDFIQAQLAIPDTVTTGRMIDRAQFEAMINANYRDLMGRRPGETGYNGRTLFNGTELNNDLVKQFFKDNIMGSTLVRLNNSHWPADTPLPGRDTQVLSAVMTYHLNNPSGMPTGRDAIIEHYNGLTYGNTSFYTSVVNNSIIRREDIPLEYRNAQTIAKFNLTDKTKVTQLLTMLVTLTDAQLADEFQASGALSSRSHISTHGLLRDGQTVSLAELRELRAQTTAGTINGATIANSPVRDGVQRLLVGLQNDSFREAATAQFGITGHATVADRTNAIARMQLARELNPNAAARDIPRLANELVLDDAKTQRLEALKRNIVGSDPVAQLNMFFLACRGSGSSVPDAIVALANDTRPGANNAPSRISADGSLCSISSPIQLPQNNAAVNAARILTRFDFSKPETQTLLAAVLGEPGTLDQHHFNPDGTLKPTSEIVTKGLLLPNQTITRAEFNRVFFQADGRTPSEGGRRIVQAFGTPAVRDNYTQLAQRTNNPVFAMASLYSRSDIVSLDGNEPLRELRSNMFAALPAAAAAPAAVAQDSQAPPTAVAQVHTGMSDFGTPGGTGAPAGVGLPAGTGGGVNPPAPILVAGNTGGPIGGFTSVGSQSSTNFYASGYNSGAGFYSSGSGYSAPPRGGDSGFVQVHGRGGYGSGPINTGFVPVGSNTTPPLAYNNNPGGNVGFTPVTGSNGNSTQANPTFVPVFGHRRPEFAAAPVAPTYPVSYQQAVSSIGAGAPSGFRSVQQDTGFVSVTGLHAFTHVASNQSPYNRPAPESTTTGVNFVAVAPASTYGSARFAYS